MNGEDEVSGGDYHVFLAQFVTLDVTNLEGANTQ